MSKSFIIQHEWLHSVQSKRPEQAAQAEICILVNGTCLTENVDLLEETTRQSARLSALHLSEWFATNWWRLLWETDDGMSTRDWQMCHKIGAAGGGYLWPDLSFSSDWNMVLVRSLPTVPSVAEPIHYSRDYNHFISATSFEQGIDDFINSTIARLSTTATMYKELAELWDEVVKERGNPEFAEWRKLEACLGYDPDEAPTDLLESLQKEYAHYGTSVIQELAAASKSKALDHLHTVAEGVQSQGTTVMVPQCEDIRKRISAQTDQLGTPPWQRGTLAAKVARQIWNLGRGPIQNSKLSDIFGFHSSETRLDEWDNTPQVPLSAGLRDDNVVDGFRVLLNQRHVNGRRFTLARLIADHLEAQQNESLLPATRARTSRQKFQRAFAQEFLCPFEELEGFLSGTFPYDDDINDAAAYFEVSPLTIKTTLVNKGYLEREQVLGD